MRNSNQENRSSDLLFHSFNNRLFKLGLLTESLQARSERDTALDEDVVALLERIKSTVHEIADSAQEIQELFTC